MTQGKWQLKTAAALILAMGITTAYGSSTLEAEQGEPESYDRRQKTVTVRKEEKRSVMRGILMYLPNRAFDLLDTLHLNASFGPPGAVNVRATDKLWVGASELNVHRVGLIGERTSFYEKEVIHDECGFNALDIAKCGCTPRPPMEVGVDVHCGIGARIAIDFTEIGDFFAGWIGKDPSHDDVGPFITRSSIEEEDIVIIRKMEQDDMDYEMERGMTMTSGK